MSGYPNTATGVLTIIYVKYPRGGIMVDGLKKQ